MKQIDELNRQWLSDEQNKVSVSVSGLGTESEETAQKMLQDQFKSERQSGQKLSIWKDLLFLLIKVASILIGGVLSFTFLFGIVRYQEPSMNPMIKDGDLVIFYRYTSAGYLPQDVIILKHGGQKQARRVAATAGDTVDITEDGLVINGAIQHEPEIYQKTERYQEGINFPLIVPEGHIFVLGDSRVGAEDSRIYGCVKIKDTLGKVMTVIRRRSI